MSHSHHSSNNDDEKHAGYGWLAFCVIGMMSSLTLYGIALEYSTSGGRKLDEWSFVFVTTFIYSLTAFIARTLFNEKPTEISKYHMLTLSFTSIASTFTSVRSLKYVIYPVQVLFKSCKPVPVMAFNVMLGKRYKLVKYVNVIIITLGVGLFMGGGNATTNNSTEADTTLIGALMLTISLCFDGATGAYEDKLMSKHNVEPFDLMYNIQLGKCIISFCIIIATNGLNKFLSTINDGGFSLVTLGITGAVGQVFVFVTISKFGALNCALIGLCRKMLSLILSFVLYGHTMNAFQTVGLTLALISMVANFYEKGGNNNSNHLRIDKNIKGSDVNFDDEKSSLLGNILDDIVYDEVNHATTSNNSNKNSIEMISSNTKSSNRGFIKDLNNNNNNIDLLEFVEDSSYDKLPDATIETSRV